MAERGAALLERQHPGNLHSGFGCNGGVLMATAVALSLRGNTEKRGWGRLVGRAGVRKLMEPEYWGWHFFLKPPISNESVVGRNGRLSFGAELVGEVRLNCPDEACPLPLQLLVW